MSHFGNLCLRSKIRSLTLQCALFIGVLILACPASADQVFRRPKVNGVVLTAAWIPQITAQKFCEIEKQSALISFKISKEPIRPGTVVTRANLFSADDWGLTFQGFLEPTQDKFYDSITCRKDSNTRIPWFLCDHPESMISSDSQGAGIFFHRVSWQTEVWIDGVRYEHAIGMHPGTLGGDHGSSRADFSIPLGATIFKTSLGLARQDIHPNDFGNARFTIVIDGREVWTGVAEGPKVIHVPEIRIPSKAKVLRLITDSNGSRWSDHATWVNTHFTFQR